MKHVGKNLWRGPRPKSWQVLKDQGIEVAFKLQSGAHEEFYDDLLEKEEASEYGITLVNIPCSDFLPPKIWQLEKFLRLLRVYSDRNCYVFCRHGKDRTGVFSAAFKMVIQGWSWKMAESDMFENGFHKLPYVLWLPFVKRRILNIIKKGRFYD